ncbi:MAG: sigma-54 dependent transcriptional regulator [bacterium]|nr:sigma-54 dependent transcriptional regulator [bacterium]
MAQKDNIFQRTILIVEDDPKQLQAISNALQEPGYRLLKTSSPDQAAEILDRESVDILITELIPRTDPLRLPQLACARTPPIPVIIVTEYGTVENAVEAIKIGALNYITKPPRAERLISIVQRAVNLRELLPAPQQTENLATLGGLLGASPGMQAVFKQIRQVTRLRSTVLITGESGTGKELVARAIHTFSPRNKGAFIPVNCSALPDELVESHLFGHERGAFTGASSLRSGFFEAADHGTLFLDEIGDLSLAAQAKLLRALEDQQILRVGSTNSFSVDVRLLAATNIDLEAAVRERRFREDLYYRLEVFTIALPPLRERQEDIPQLVSLFLDHFAIENDREPKTIAPDALAALLTYSWPGNVRELKNTIESLAITSSNPSIQAADLPAKIIANSNASDLFSVSVGTSLEDIEKDVIRHTLNHTGGNRTRTAKLLKIGLRTLQRKMKHYGIS